MDTVFESFETGVLVTAQGQRELAALPWNNHPKFDGVSLKHLVAAEDTDGRFSFHLVRIAPGKEIGDHTHDPQLETHEVVARYDYLHPEALVGDKTRNSVVSTITHAAIMTSMKKNDQV